MLISNAHAFIGIQTNPCNIRATLAKVKVTTFLMRMRLECFEKKRDETAYYRL